MTNSFRRAMMYNALVSGQAPDGNYESALKLALHLMVEHDRFLSGIKDTATIDHFLWAWHLAIGVGEHPRDLPQKVKEDVVLKVLTAESVLDYQQFGLISEPFLSCQSLTDAVRLVCSE